MSERLDPQPPEPGLIESRPLYNGRVVKLAIDTVRFPDGSAGELEMIRHSGAAAVLPLLDDDVPDPRIVLIRQYRYAAGGFLLEVPAGKPDMPGEDWEAVARRELQEEAGLVAESMTYLTTIFTTPGFTDEQIRLYLATSLRKGVQSLERDEFVEPVELRLSEALAAIRSGDISDAKTICTLLFYTQSRRDAEGAGRP
jgi:ADP-ribose pyrophosphatase